VSWEMCAINVEDVVDVIRCLIIIFRWIWFNGWDFVVLQWFALLGAYKYKAFGCVGKISVFLQVRIKHINIDNTLWLISSKQKGLVIENLWTILKLISFDGFEWEKLIVIVFCLWVLVAKRKWFLWSFKVVILVGRTNQCELVAFPMGVGGMRFFYEYKLSVWPKKDV